LVCVAQTAQSKRLDLTSLQQIQQMEMAALLAENPKKERDAAINALHNHSKRPFEEGRDLTNAERH